MKKTLVSIALAASLLAPASCAKGIIDKHEVIVVATKKANLEEKTALMIVDMQDPFMNAISKQELKREIPHYLELIEYAKKENMPVFVLEYSWTGPTTEVIKEKLRELEDVTYLIKESNSGFRTTDLEERLKEKGIKNIIMSGAYASACVIETSFDAIDKGFNLITSKEIISDGDPKNGYHDWGENIEWYSKNSLYFDDFDDLMEALKKK